MTLFSFSWLNPQKQKHSTKNLTIVLTEFFELPERTFVCMRSWSFDDLFAVHKSLREPPLTLARCQPSISKDSLDRSLLVLVQRRIEFQYFYLQHLQFATGNYSRHPKNTRKPFYCHVCCHSFSTSREVGQTFAPSESDTTNLQHVAMENLPNVSRKHGLFRLRLSGPDCNKLLSTSVVTLPCSLADVFLVELGTKLNTEKDKGARSCNFSWYRKQRSSAGFHSSSRACWFLLYN